MNGLIERGYTCDAVYLKGPHDLSCAIRRCDDGTVVCADAARYLDLRAIGRFAARIAAVRPSVIVAANPYALMYAAFARRSAGVRAPLVVTYHSTRPSGAKERLQLLAYRPLFWGADCAVFVSERQRAYCRRRGLLARRSEVIHNGVDVAAFRARAEPSAAAPLRSELGLDDGDYVIGISAWLRPEKNHRQLVDAVARLLRAGIPSRALVIGDGPLRAAVESHARALGISERVIITGAQPDVRPYLALCDVVVLCSVTETFSMAALEAMAMGKAVVHSAVGGAAEMIYPGRNGFLFRAGDTDQLVVGLTALSDRATAERLGAQARTIVEQRFSRQRMLDRYEELLLALSRRQSGGRAT